MFETLRRVSLKNLVRRLLTLMLSRSDTCPNPKDIVVELCIAYVLEISMPECFVVMLKRACES
jgi:hypothetical protein